jgi:hypothetical protein
VLITHHHCIRDVRAGFQGILNRLGGYKFAARGFQQILFAIGDEEIVVGVEISDVAGMEPAIFANDFTRGFGTLLIALHDARSLG